MELPACLSAAAMRVRHWLVWSATSASSAPTGPVPETWTWLPMRTAREKPMIGSKGEVPEMLVRVMEIRLCGDRRNVEPLYRECGEDDEQDHHDDLNDR